MSRAFVNEDKAVEDLPDRPVSSHPNYVTSKGLALIDAALEQAAAAWCCLLVVLLLVVPAFRPPRPLSLHH